jgi:hypothetical protein
VAAAYKKPSTQPDGSSAPWRSQYDNTTTASIVFGQLFGIFVLMLLETYSSDSLSFAMRKSTQETKVLVPSTLCKVLHW